MKEDTAGLRARRNAVSRNRAVAALLLAAFSLLVFFYLWWGRFQYADSLMLTGAYLATALCVAAGHWYFRDSLRSIGLRLDNLAASARVAAIPTSLAAAVIATTWLASGRGLPAAETVPTSYFGGALLQQYILQAFLLARFRSVFARAPMAVVAAAALFALFHLPNLPLMAASFAGALLWCSVFVKAPNLPVVAVSHLVLGLLLAAGFKDDLDYFRVGRGGHPYTIFGDGVQVAGGIDSSGRPFVATLPGFDRDHPSIVRLFRPDGTPLVAWDAFPEYGFSGTMAVGDLDGDPGDEIAVAPGPGAANPSEVRIFDTAGREQNRFRLPAASGYGASVAIADGSLWVAPGPGPEVAPDCYQLAADGTATRRWTLAGTGFVNSIRCVGWPPDGILAWPTLLAVNRAQLHRFGPSGRLEETWTPLATNYAISVARFRTGDGPGVVVAPGALQGHPSHVQVLDGSGRAVSSFHVDTSPESCGANVGSVDVDGDGLDEILLGEGMCPGRPARVRVLTMAGELLHEWLADRGTRQEPG